MELARDQYTFCPCYPGTEPVLSRPTSPAAVVPKLEPPANSFAVKPKPSPDSPSELLYPSKSSSTDSSPIYAQSIGVASASPSPTPKPQSQSAPTSSATNPFNPFDVDASKTSPEPTQEYQSIHKCSQTPGVTGPQLDIAQQTGAPPNTALEASVWDNENVYEPPEQIERRATMDDVYQFLCALCADWRTTAPETVRATVARSADYLRLGIFLGIVVSDEGRIDFLKRTIPGAHGLLTTISTGVTTTTTSMETASNEESGGGEVTDPDDLVPVFVGIPDHKAQKVTLPDGRVVHVVRMGSAT
ncbi:hypothetical protein Moror_4933 [Moniliophthora roreri MCA 2997]|uniref:Uncharacterized protein n=1 Tax=Moniliophthora roreri (strain MCA 2997) TaxID=1381753 RepID=V2X0W9_MONRO|nr:hypothetical protein Moror_4933 [Moniliophthora roreri MCA 2997]